MKHELFVLKSQLYDAKAVANNLPHRDLNKLIPFRSDEDLLTCLNDADLNNALFAKVGTYIRSTPRARDIYIYIGVYCIY